MEAMKKAIKQYRNMWVALDFNVNSNMSSSFSVREFEEVDSAEIWAALLTAIGLHYPKRE
jgi:hypothetical protein